MVAVRSDPVDSGVVATASPPRLVHAAAARGYAVAGSNRLLAGDHRCAHPRRPHRLTTSPQPLRMAVARLWVGPRLSVAGAELRRVRACGGAGVVGGPRDHLPRAAVGRTGGAYSSTLAHAAVPHGAAAVAPMASPSLDLGGGGSGAPVLGYLLRKPRPGRRSGKHCGLCRGVRYLHRDSPLGALDRCPLPPGEWSGAPTVKVVCAGRRSDRLCHRRAPAISRRAATRSVP